MTASTGHAARRFDHAEMIVPKRRPGYLGHVHVLQLMLVEIVAISLLLAFTRDRSIAVRVLWLAVVALAIILGRRGGRWWLEQQIVLWEYRHRKRTRAAAQPESHLGAMRLLAPELAVHNVVSGDGPAIGVARDEEGWFAAAAIVSAPAWEVPVPLQALVSALVGTGQAGMRVQLVSHAVPAPIFTVGPISAVGRSYRELLRRHAFPIAADLATWVVVRLDARALAEAGVRDADAGEQAPAVTAALVNRATRILSRENLSAAALDRVGLLRALTRSCDVDGADGSPGVVAPHETWTAWHSGRLAHRTYWLRHWPGGSAPGQLLRGVGATGAAFVSVALTLVPRDDDVDIRCLIRVAAPPAEINRACKSVTREAGRLRMRLLRLDGEQAPAVYASAPTGGGAM